MDGSRFDEVVRSMAGQGSRRGFIGSMLGLGAGVLGLSSVVAACPPGQVSKRTQCVCKLSGRPPVGGVCPCPNGQTDSGDGQGCVSCHAAGDCPVGDACVSYACVGGSCARTRTVCPKFCDPMAGCVACRSHADCPPPTPCTTYACLAGACNAAHACGSGGCTATTEGVAYCGCIVDFPFPKIACDATSDCPAGLICAAEIFDQPTFFCTELPELC